MSDKGKGHCRCQCQDRGKPVEMCCEDDTDAPSAELSRFRLRMFVALIITTAIAVAYLLFLD